MENSMKVPQEIKIKTVMWYSNAALGMYREIFIGSNSINNMKNQYEHILNHQGDLITEGT